MSLTHYIESKFRPTNDQCNAFKALDRFFKSDSSAFLLKGYAGTGKTTITKYLADFLEQEKRSFKLMAPTGRAARILTQKTGHEATTIHKSIYNLEDVDEIELNKNGKKTYKFRFNLKIPDPNIGTVYLVDEASMIADNYSENEFFIFGSGHLLKDLLTYTTAGVPLQKSKIIFIGDPLQLPPVNDNKSKALIKETLKNEYQVSSDEYELKQVVRQDAESGILKVTDYLRTLLSNPGRSTFQLPTDVANVYTLQNKDIVTTYLKENADLKINRTVIINHSNKSAFEYNQQVRKGIFKKKSEIAKGDILIINRNNYNYKINLLNGTFVTVVETGSLEIKSNMKSFDRMGTECKVTHKFRNVVIAVPYNKEWLNVNCFILDNFLNSAAPNLTYEENVALYLDFKIRHPKLKPKTKEFIDALRSDPYFNAVNVKYGYAVTCHKAQGGEWHSAIVNMDITQSMLSDYFLRWTYTAVTRAQTKLYLFNQQNKSKFSAMELQYILLSEKNKSHSDRAVETIIYSPPEDIDDKQVDLKLNVAEKFIRDKHLDILARLNGRKIRIIGRIGKPFQEHYIFEKEGKKTLLIFYYNRKHYFTSILVNNSRQYDQTLGEEIKEICTSPANIHVTSNNQQQEEKTKTFSFEGFEDLEILYQSIVPLTAKKKIEIDSIEHFKYQEVYHFKRGEERVVIQFFYDIKNNFTRVKPILGKSNSNSLLKSVYQIVRQLKKN